MVYNRGEDSNERGVMGNGFADSSSHSILCWRRHTWKRRTGGEATLHDPVRGKLYSIPHDHIPGCD